MNDLTTAVLILDYDRIQEDADTIVADMSLTRPLGGDATDLTLFLPEPFFRLQDELKRHAHDLSAAATRSSPADVAKMFGQLADTCVRCHAVYQQGL